METGINSFQGEEEYSPEYAKGDSLEGSSGLPLACEICKKDFTDPVILHCLHVFDKTCLRKFEVKEEMFPYTKCPKCNEQSGSIDTLEPYNLLVVKKFEVIGNENDSQITIKCSNCVEGSEAAYKCLDCPGTLCQRCRDIHKVMKVLTKHNVMDLTEDEKQNGTELNRQMQDSKPVMCGYHPKEAYKYFCFQCHVPICAECMVAEHKLHITTNIEEVPKRIESVIKNIVSSCQQNHTRLREQIETLNNILMDLNTSCDQNKSHIEEVCNDWKSAIDSIKEELLKQNKELHAEVEFKVMDQVETAQKTVDHIDYAVEFTESYLERCSTVEMSKISKVVIGCLENLSKVDVKADFPATIKFAECPGKIPDVIRSQFGAFEVPKCVSTVHSLNDRAADVATSAALSTLVDQPGAAGDISAGFGYSSSEFILSESAYLAAGRTMRPLQDSPTGSQGSSRGGATSVLSVTNGSLDPSGIPHTAGTPSLEFAPNNSIGGGLMYPYGLDLDPTSAINLPNILSSTSRTGTPSSLGPVIESNYGIDPSVNCMNPSVLTGGSITGSISASNPAMGNQPIAKPGSQAGYNPNPNPPFPNRVGRCVPMNVRARWGALGNTRGMLSSPHGFCLGIEEEIVVADTQNHRIQIFDKSGNYLSHFGVPGREEGQLWYPRKVAILRTSQRYVVCDRGNERSRMQIFGRSGHFIKKIAIRYIDIVAGLAINAHGHIVAVDSVSPSVFVVTENGDLVKWFDCSNYMREPSDIAVHGREYYICDFKGHCVAVFQEDGVFIRRIGSDMVTNYPNGIDVSDHGDVLIGDSHGNRFHIAVYSRQGNLQTEFECPSVKVSRCCGLKITTEGYVVTLAKNNHHVLVLDTLYIC